MVQLVSGRSNEGYISALCRSFELEKTKMPVKSSFSKYRKKISYKFFSSIFYKLIGDFQKHRSTFRGRRFYAIDGKRLYIPRSKELEKKGYMAKTLSDHRESYLLRTHITHAFDIFSGVTKAIKIGPKLNEIEDAMEMVQNFESGSVSLYDRLFLSKKLIRLHLKKRNYFIMRAKSSSTLKEIVEFAKSSKSYDSFKFEGVELYLLKRKNKNGDNRIFLTNLVEYSKAPKKVDLLYRERWDVESSFKELVESLSLEQWHSYDENSILQEFFTRMWLYNFTKIQIFNMQKKTKKVIGESYHRTNLKACVEWVIRNFQQVMKKKRGIFKGLRELIKISTEKRKRYSRSYEREIKRPASRYKYNNTLWLHELKS